MSKPDFIKSMIKFADHQIKSGQSAAFEKDATGRMKRWLSPGDQALKVPDDGTGTATRRLR